MKSFAFIDEEIERRLCDNRLRRLRPVMPVNAVETDVNGRVMVNFCSNDYLGLSKNPTIRERAAEYAKRYGGGATASRLICGNMNITEQVERKLAGLKGTETALILNSGFQANISVIPALCDKNTLILSDRLNHNSIIQGIRLAQCRKGVFRHNDMAHLAQLLRESRTSGASRVIVITESVFSMDGDLCDLDAVEQLADEYGAILMVDEAHATGVMGEKGMGLACGRNVDIAMGTFSKALGGFGAYIACSERMRNFLVNCCPGVIYSTALPPAVIGAADAALDLAPGMEEDRTRLRRNADRLRAALKDIGLDTGSSASQIVPVLIGGETETLALSAFLEENGMFATAIRPPTVAPGSSRIRLALSSEHTGEQIDRLIAVFQEWVQT